MQTSQISDEVRRAFSDMGKKGGVARARRLSPRRRREIARKAARAKWRRRRKTLDQRA